MCGSRSHSPATPCVCVCLCVCLCMSPAVEEDAVPTPQPDWVHSSQLTTQTFTPGQYTIGRRKPAGPALVCIRGECDAYQPSQPIACVKKQGGNQVCACMCHRRVCHHPGNVKITYPVCNDDSARDLMLPSEYCLCDALDNCTRKFHCLTSSFRGVHF